MENSITRIADLPVGIPAGQSQAGMPIGTRMDIPTGQVQGPSTNYMPINPHPNPYGNNAQNPVMAHPQVPGLPMPNFASVPAPPPPQSQYLSEEQQMQLAQQSQYRLPSRDIPQDSTGYLQDEQVQANYIPPPKKRVDFVRDHEDMRERDVLKHEEKKRAHQRIDDFLAEFQTPIFVALLFFLFQLPMINTLVFTRFSCLSIYNLDGNFNFMGLVLKSAIFGALYYVAHTSMNYLAEI